jgi:hypothetical protein
VEDARRRPGGMSLEWDELVKPAIYAWELVLSSVVAFGTADKLLYSAGAGGTRCALNDSVATCSVVIAIGSLCFLGAAFTLWRRLLAAFTNDVFPKVDESGMCGLLAVGWLVVASVVSSNLSLPESAGRSEFKTMRDVVVAFSWMNFVSFVGSAALAAYKPEGAEAGEAHLEYQNIEDEWSPSLPSRGCSAPNADDEGVDLTLRGGGVASMERDERLELAGLRRVDGIPNPFDARPPSDGDVKPSAWTEAARNAASPSVVDQTDLGFPRRRRPPVVGFITPSSEAMSKDFLS